ncbi:MAG: class I SAM-dependent methyltransferase [Flavipsychrobacter sp.]|nr:class I SAM-dependent methyltransferase [Flavipsychrobacter sp.]
MIIENQTYSYDAGGGIGYAQIRRTDPRIAAVVHHSLADARTILNIGAGAGSYEPEDKYVVAVEPSAIMRAQRIERGKSPAVIGFADKLPFDDNAFDATMAMATIHHWPDMAAGLAEMRRVAKNTVVVMTFDPSALKDFWNIHYFPDVVAAEKKRYPEIDFITNCLGNCEVIEVPVPLDCVDGFQEAFYGRPEAFLDANVRKAQSAWSFVSDDVVARSVQHLADELASGEWDKKYGHYRTQPFFTGSIRLVVARK